MEEEAGGVLADWYRGTTPRPGVPDLPRGPGERIRVPHRARGSVPVHGGGGAHVFFTPCVWSEDGCGRKLRNGSGHSCRIFARDDVCGNRVTEGQEDPRLTGKTHVFNSTYNEDQKSSIQLTMTIRNLHTPTTFTSMQLTMTRRNRHAPTTLNYPCRHSLTNE